MYSSQSCRVLGAKVFTRRRWFLEVLLHLIYALGTTVLLLQDGLLVSRATFPWLPWQLWGPPPRLLQARKVLYFPTFYSVVAFNPSAVSSCFCWPLDLLSGRPLTQTLHTYSTDEFRRRKEKTSNTLCGRVCVQSYSPSFGWPLRQWSSIFSINFAASVLAILAFAAAAAAGDARRQFQFQSISARC